MKGDTMDMVGLGLLLVGAGIALVYGIQLIIQAFKESAMWGLIYLFVPFGALIYIIKFWDNAKKPFLMSLIAIPFYIIGMILAASAQG
jgi:uncharacterized membrane protein